MIIRLMDALLKSGGFFCCILFAYLSARHGWDSHYLLVLSTGVAVLALRYAPVEYRCNAALVLVALSTTLYAANIILAIKAEVEGKFPRSHLSKMWLGAVHVSTLARVAEQLGLEFDTRTRLKIMLDLRESGVDAWPSIPSSNLFKDWPHRRLDPIIALDGVPALPLGGISKKVTVYCNENGSYILLDYDEFGFSNPRGLWSADVVDIAVVGDSFAQGACVPKEESFPALLREQFPSTLNLGNDGNGPLADLATIREYLPGLKPKIVLWVYCETNDLTDLARERESLLARYTDNSFSQGLIHKQGEIDRALMAYTELMIGAGAAQNQLSGLLEGMIDRTNYVRELEQIVKLSYIWKMIAHFRGTTFREGNYQPTSEAGPIVTDRELDLFQRVLRLGRDTVSNWGGEMVFVYLPQFERYSGQAGASPHREQVLSIAGELGIAVVDIHRAFASHPDPLDLFPFRHAGHYTPRGYRLVAEEIERYLERRKLSRALRTTSIDMPIRRH